jgi:hypothetical protein
MDEIALIRELAPRGSELGSARTAARRKLEAHIELASAGKTRRGFSTRRRLLSIAGVGVAAAVLAGVVVLNSGPTAQPAVAEVLHETAAVAVSSDAPPALIPGPGQFLYTKEKAVEFEGWYPNSYTVAESPASRPGGFSAEIPKDREIWLSQGGSSRLREEIGTPQFHSDAEKTRWEQGGSFLPGAFDERSPLAGLLGQAPDEKVIQASRGIVDVERRVSDNGPTDESNYPDLSGNPTNPEALRLAVQNHHAPGISDEPASSPLGQAETIEDLTGLLHHPNASPALRAAAFNALAEIPGVELNRDATDLLGRPGYAISAQRGNYDVRDEFIIDPETSILLGERTVLIDASDRIWRGYQAGLVIRNVADLGSRIVDSSREPN